MTETTDLLAEAVRVLTIAANGHQEPADWAEFVTLAIAGAAANVGSVERALAGRPGSWEAETVRTMLRAAVGEEPATLWAHRTDPVRIVVNVDDVLTEIGYAELYYTEAEAELQRREDQLGIPTLIYVPDDPFYDERAAALPPASEAQEAARDQLYELRDQLEEQRVGDWTAYGEAFRANILTAAAELLPGLPVPVEVVLNLELQDGPGGAYDRNGPEEALLSHARLATPLPCSGVPYGEYPLAQSMLEVERAAGRLPLTRLETTRTNH